MTSSLLLQARNGRLRALSAAEHARQAAHAGPPGPPLRGRRTLAATRPATYNLNRRSHRQSSSSRSASSPKQSPAVASGSSMSSQLFRIFGKDKVSGHSQLKASVQRAIRGALLPLPPQPPPLLVRLCWRCAAHCIVPLSPCRQNCGGLPVPGGARPAGCDPAQEAGPGAGQAVSCFASGSVVCSRGSVLPPGHIAAGCVSPMLLSL